MSPKEDVAQSALVCIARWASSRIEFDSISTSGILHNWEASHLGYHSTPSKLMLWVSPSEGEFKFNVDGVARGKPGLVSIGGVLRNSFGVVFAIFSKHVGTMESTEAKVLAIL